MSDTITTTPKMQITTAVTEPISSELALSEGGGENVTSGVRTEIDKIKHIIQIAFNVFITHTGIGHISVHECT